MASADVERRRAVALLRDAVVTIAVLLLAFAAFDDITTGNESDFTTEYAALIGCAGWLVFLGGRLLRNGHRALGSLSLLALVGVLWSQRAIGPDIAPGLWPEYLITAGVFVWFAALSVILLALAWRARPDAGGKHAL